MSMSVKLRPNFLAVMGELYPVLTPADAGLTAYYYADEDPGFWNGTMWTFPTLVHGNDGDPVDNSSYEQRLAELTNMMDSLRTTSFQRTSVERLTVQNNGQMRFTLTQTPVEKESTEITVNGLHYLYGTGGDFTISGAAVVWSNVSLVLAPEDVVIVRYKYA